MGAFGDSIDKYDVYELLGKGGFGHVYRARVRETGVEVAIKMIDKKLMKAAGMVNRVKQEVNIHSRLKHESVLELYTCFEDESNVYLVLELCHNGELASYMKTRKSTFTEDEARHIMRQVVDGLLYLHSHNIMHRDITLANLLLTKDMKVKIGDFGLATQIAPNEKHMTMCGTPNYISPEIVVRASHGLETDVWGLGIMLYTILVGKPPFDTENRGMIMTLVVIKDIDFPGSLSNDAKDLIKSLLQKKPENRIKLSQIMEHPFMSRSFYYYGIPPSSNCDSGMASSLPSSSQTKSLSDRIFHKDDNILGAATQPYPLLPNPPVQHHQSTHKTSGYSNSNCFSTNSISSNHGCPVPFQNGLCDRRTTETSQHGAMQNSYVQRSMEIPPIDASRQRFYSGSNAPTISRMETNCSHAWKQCGGGGQCSHVETCGCVHERERHVNVSSNGFVSSYPRSNASYSSCMNANNRQQDQGNIVVTRKPPTPLPDQQPVIVENTRGLPTKSQIPSLNTNRIKPIRQKTKQVILHILDTGEVCLEFLKQKNKSEKVFEVMRISSDGQRIVVYYPNKGKGVTSSDNPPPLPPGGADGIFWHENLPEKFLKKYSYASRFVDLVKAQTPKITYYSHKAKCMLMENGPNADFQANFYDGAKFCKTGTQVKISDEAGWTSTQHVSYDGEGLPPPVKIMWDHFKLCFEDCQTREKLLDDVCTSTGLSMFPNRIGERPSTSKKNASLMKDKNTSSETITSPSSVVGKKTESTVSRSSASSQGKILKQAYVPNVGHAMQMANGVVCVHYSDNSKLYVEPRSSKISFEDPSGNSKQYQQHDVIPQDAREKLTHVHRIFEALKSA